jgi:Ankyrin repeats (many copies)
MLGLRYTLKNFEDLLNLPEEKFRNAFIADKKLIKARADQNKTVLHHAVRLAAIYENNDESLLTKIKILLELGADINAKDELGRTSLHTAAQYGDATKLIYYDIFPLLLEEAKKQNFNFNQQDKDGSTVLLWAATKVYNAGLNFFLLETNVSKVLNSSISVDSNIKNRHGLTPLYLSIRKGIQETEIPSWVNYNNAIHLVHSGADPEKKTAVSFYTEKTHRNMKGEEISALELIEGSIQNIQQQNNVNDTNTLIKLKEFIILARLMFLTEQTLKNYETSRKGRGSPNPQRTILVSEIRTMLNQIINNKSGESEHTNLLEHIQTLVDTLQSCSRRAEEHHKNNGTLIFFGYGPTSSGLARELNKLASHSLLKYVDIKVHEVNPSMVQLFK